VDTADRLEQLKARFRPALEFIDRGQFHIQALIVQDDRLLVRIVVKSAEVRDQVIQQFQQIDPSLDQVHPDIRIEAADNVPHTGQSTVQTSGEISRG
jgi:hypothetical protein